MSKKLHTSSSLELKFKARTYPTSSIAPEALNNQIPELNVPQEAILALLTYWLGGSCIFPDRWTSLLLLKLHEDRSPDFLFTTFLLTASTAMKQIPAKGWNGISGGDLTAYLACFFQFLKFFYCLQCCIGFCHRATWISHNYTYIPSLLSLPPFPHPPLLGHHRVPDWAPCVIQQLGLV